MKNQIIIFFAYLTCAVLFWVTLQSQTVAESDQVIAKEYFPEIVPDYLGVTIPPNIAPLNFIIKEAGEKFEVKVTGQDETTLEIKSRDGNIQFPMKAWKRLLAANRGRSISLNISTKVGDSLHQYPEARIHVAEEPIDAFMTYRLINPASVLWADMGIYQRNLETFDESVILKNRMIEDGCVNCHTFNHNDPERFLLHIRKGDPSGTLLYRNGELLKVNTATDFNRAGTYASWHPNSNIIAFSVNKLEMFFHAVGEPRDVLDRASDIIIYNIAKNQVTAKPSFADTARMETFPAWSPKGNYLYFCSCPPFESFLQGNDFNYQDIYYDLYRVPYDAESDTWGDLELVLDSQTLNASLTQPQVSPDDQYLMFCASDDGHFPIYKPSTDLYLLNLHNGDYRRLEVNSDQAETFHRWSSDGRWFVFSSKRLDGTYARPHFAYFEEDGSVHKPFVLPQKDPEYYSSYLTTYNRPELITGPISVRPQVLVKTAYDNVNKINATLDPQIVTESKVKDDGIMYRVAP